MTMFLDETLPCWADDTRRGYDAWPYFEREAIERLSARIGNCHEWHGDTLLLTLHQYEYQPVHVSTGALAWTMGGFWDWGPVEFEA